MIVDLAFHLLAGDACLSALHALSFACSSLSSLVYAVCEATSRYRQLSFATIHRQRTVTTSGELTNDNATTQFPEKLYQNWHNQNRTAC